ncbi:hypothetical protein A7P54_11495 [Acinetobacter sp. Ac_3412]|uniref:hypothetical protein n=1 Tax=Acinetobacter sp. Ac_3412 TaxID=1848935 RepID=UPI00148FB57A|nr:hypothetical protein [Acinetobacter sp. Ac_3412]NNP77040.1 hypothetical protein [Acinetobacter sp. Ac_3412]
MLKIVNLFKKHHNSILKKSERSFFDPMVLGNYCASYGIEYLDFEDFSGEKFIDKLHELCAEDLTYIIILKDERIELNQELYKSIFIGSIDVSLPDTSNAFITNQIAKRLKQFNIVKASFSTADEIELMRLPFRSFQSEILERLRLTMITLDPSTFNDEFEGCIRDIKRVHRKPMKRPQSRKRYLIDEKSLHFELGKELHARHETGNPHTQLCDLNARYRFGCAIDPIRHYNACNANSSSNLLTLNLFDCHKAIRNIVNRTHINVFSNDHIA